MSAEQGVEGFCIQRGFSGREVNAAMDGFRSMGLRVIWASKAKVGWIPMGDVEFCAPAFGPHRIDFYPEFLTKWLCRMRHRTSRRIDFDMPVFVKSAKDWKTNFISRVVQPGEVVPLGDYWVSEVVEFVQEWRYYVANGRLVTTGWYQGSDEEEAAPELSVEWPEGFSGAVDFGRLDDGRMALVEAHAPFACGWYGDNHKDYAEWLLESWQHRDWWKL